MQNMFDYYIKYYYNITIVYKIIQNYLEYYLLLWLDYISLVYYKIKYKSKKYFKN